MTEIIWTPVESLLGTVKEFENFSHSISYQEIDEILGPTNFPVAITPVSLQETIITLNGDPASISGYFKYIFFDTIIYLDFENNIVVKSGTETQGTWEQIDMNEVYQMIEFIPDTIRFRTFEFIATANGNQKTYTIDVSDQNWTPGLNALQNAVSIIRSRGN